MKPLGEKVHGLNKHVRETVKRAKRRQNKKGRRLGVLELHREMYERRLAQEADKQTRTQERP